MEIKKITQKDSQTLQIVWSDGHVSEYDVVILRRECPCAQCVDEWTHERTLDPNSISESIRPVGLKSVGRYAIQIDWSDGHSTGLYAFETLRKLCRCPQCTTRK